MKLPCPIVGEQQRRNYTGALVLAFAAKPMSQLAARFGAPEAVMAIVLAALCVGRAYQRQFLVAVAMMALGWAKVRHRDGATGFVRATQVWGL